MNAPRTHAFSQALWAAARAGDADALRAVVDLHLPRLFGLARACLGDGHRAEGIAQTALAAALASPGLPAEVDGWLVAHAARQIVAALADGAAPLPRADPLAPLAPTDRLVFLLADGAHLPRVQIAAILGRDATAVKGMLHRARARLAQQATPRDRA